MIEIRNTDLIFCYWDEPKFIKHDKENSSNPRGEENPSKTEGETKVLSGNNNPDSGNNSDQGV